MFEVSGAGLAVASGSLVVSSGTAEAGVAVAADPGVLILAAVATGVEFVIPGISFIESDGAGAEFWAIPGMSFMLS